MFNTYIPKKNDIVDEALANFVNNYPNKDKMKILFLRESEGFYQFGQRKVHVKVEKNGKVLVRVGGGYISAAEFIETYTPVEVTKIHRQDVSNKLAHKIRS